MADKKNKGQSPFIDLEDDEPVKKESSSKEDKESQSSAQSDKKEETAETKADIDINELQEALKKKESQLAEEKDKYLRLYAEYDNYRRRSAKEREGVYADAYADALKTLLPILDNLERAKQFSDAEAVAKGLEMTCKGFEEALEKMGVTEIKSEGNFDPNLHNAVMHVEDDNFGENEIVEVFQKGYQKGDRIIRYAMVKVAN